MNTNRITNKDALVYIMNNYDLPTEIRTKVKAMVEQLDKKSTTKKSTKADEERSAIKSEILKTIGTNSVRVADMVSHFGNAYSSQKLSALMNQLVKEGKLYKGTIKRVTYFNTKPIEVTE